MNKMYRGMRSSNGARVWIEDDNGKSALPLYLNVRSHSPDGFEWGYGGSGPAQLALAICMDTLKNKEWASRVYQEFKHRAIAPIQSEDWSLTEEQVRKVITEIEPREPREFECRARLTVRCLRCVTLWATPEQWKAWETGGLVPTVFPEMDPGEREMLITATCNECWNSMFAKTP